MKKVLIAILLLGLLPHASADYIHWVDFRLSAPVLRSALELDMASQGGEQPLDWIDILAPPAVCPPQSHPFRRAMPRPAPEYRSSQPSASTVPPSTAQMGVPSAPRMSLPRCGRA